MAWPRWHDRRLRWFEGGPCGEAVTEASEAAGARWIEEEKEGDGGLKKVFQPMICMGWLKKIMTDPKKL